MAGRLPSTYSGLLRAAVRDAKALERDDEHFTLSMSNWVNPSTSGGRCEVCMAGACMVRRLGWDTTKFGTPDMLPPQTEKKLRAINMLRMGHIPEADDIYDGLGIEVPMAVRYAYLRLISSNIVGDTGRCSWDIYLQGADILEAAGF